MAPYQTPILGLVLLGLYIDKHMQCHQHTWTFSSRMGGQTCTNWKVGEPVHCKAVFDKFVENYSQIKTSHKKFNYFKLFYFLFMLFYRLAVYNFLDAINFYTFPYLYRPCLSVYVCIIIKPHKLENVKSFISNQFFILDFLSAFSFPIFRGTIPWMRRWWQNIALNYLTTFIDLMCMCVCVCVKGGKKGKNYNRSFITFFLLL